MGSTATTGKPSREGEILRLAAPVVERQGLEIVDVVLRCSGSRWFLRLDIDRTGPAGVGLDECARVSGLVEQVLDEADLMTQSYVLEVSSPGLDRPIRTDDDVRRNTGRRVVVQTHEPLEGRRHFRGILRGLEGEALRLEEDEGKEVLIPRAGILKAHQEIGVK